MAKIVDYTLTIREKHGQVISTTHHATQTDAVDTLRWLSEQMHVRHDAQNCGVFDTAENGWLWDLDTAEVCIAGTYKVERVA